MTDEMVGRETVADERVAPAIEIEGLIVRYGRRRAVDGLNLTVPQGSVYGFLRPNGAGKNSTIKTLLGFRGPDGGSARVLGYDIVEESLEVRARVGFQTYSGEAMIARSVVVCLVTAAAALLLALWLFRRKTY